MASQIPWTGSGNFLCRMLVVILAVLPLVVAGVVTGPEARLDGVNLLPFLKGEKTGAPHDAHYWRLGKQMTIRAGDYKLVRYDSNADNLTGKSNQPITAARLYNLAIDIGETTDLAAAMPEKVNELQSQWDAWNADNISPGWSSAQQANGGSAPGPQSAPKARNGQSATVGK